MDRTRGGTVPYPSWLEGARREAYAQGSRDGWGDATVHRWMEDDINKAARQWARAWNKHDSTRAESTLHRACLTRRFAGVDPASTPVCVGGRVPARRFLRFHRVFLRDRCKPKMEMLRSLGLNDQALICAWFCEPVSCPIATSKTQDFNTYWNY